MHEVQSAVAWLPLSAKFSLHHFCCTEIGHWPAGGNLVIITTQPCKWRHSVLFPTEVFKNNTKDCALPHPDTETKRTQHCETTAWSKYFSLIIKVNVSVCDVIICVVINKTKKKKKVILLWTLPLYRDWCPLKFRLCQPAATSSRQGQIREVNGPVYGSLPVKSSIGWKMALV